MNVPAESLVAAALIRKEGTIDDIKEFYAMIYALRAKWTNNVNPYDKAFAGYFTYLHNSKTNFVMGFTDMSALTFLKLSYPERIITVWMNKNIDAAA